MGLGATGFVAELQRRDLAFLAGLPRVFLADQAAEDVVEIDGRDADVAMLVAADAFEILLGQELSQAFGDDDDAVFLPFLLARASS